MRLTRLTSLPAMDLTRSPRIDQNKTDSTMRRLIEIATERRVTIMMFTIAIVLFGLVSLSRLKVNLLPDLSYPTITVRTELDGAAPLEVENLITKPIEESV